MQNTAKTTPADRGIILQFDAGTLVLDGADAAARVPSAFQWDERVRRWRAPALAYRQVLTELVRSKIPHEDQARKYHEFQFRIDLQVEPRPYQRESIEAWQRGGRRGVVILPTGAGKSFVAQMAIELTGRSTLVIVPTIDLMNQWYDLLMSCFLAEIGLIGGGYFEVGAITVTTYASAFRFMERLGNQFGLIIFDECHHLPGSVYRYAAELAIAPFRLGLTATPERADGGEELLVPLIGPIVYRKEAQHLAGEFLADYSIEKITVQLTPEERAVYKRERAVFRNFLSGQGIDLGTLHGWQMFIAASARSEAGRRAMQAYRDSKRIALGTEAKLGVLTKLLHRHRRDRVLIFTAENEMVYRISEQFLIPAITHETPIKERRQWLEAFNQGKILALATSKVLNEGVNIPDASVAVVLSGSGSSREHIQRLGRILRKQPDKEAILYEVVTAGTTEERISERRSDADQFRANQSREAEEPMLDAGWLE
ncbi:MAG TPA: DEAD/DEAH box helicase family protein [Blastocatellia bacterium]|nr:DEAD/DEAH box helicase family protein [Blastocatellia bacterium]